MTASTGISRYSLYEQAFEQLQEAVDALDQARSTMKAAQVEDVHSGRWSQGLPVDGIILHMEGLIRELERAECDNCNHPLKNHDAAGCQGENGVPCDCTWGGSK